MSKWHSIIVRALGCAVIHILNGPTLFKRMAGVAPTVRVSIAVAVGMPPRMSGAVTTAEELLAPSSNCM